MATHPSLRPRISNQPIIVVKEITSQQLRRVAFLGAKATCQIIIEHTMHALHGRPL